MCQRSIFARSCSRIAEEVQLQAEEEWIVDALKKIKQQRNCLQIERLHIESLKAQLTEPTSNKAEEREELNQHVSAVTMMQPALCSIRNQDWDNNDDVLCNSQELDLMVTNPVIETQQKQDKQSEYDLEEDDDDNDDEDDDDNLMIDMNMLMNGSREMSL